MEVKNGAKTFLECLYAEYTDRFILTANSPYLNNGKELNDTHYKKVRGKEIYFKHAHSITGREVSEDGLVFFNVQNPHNTKKNMKMTFEEITEAFAQLSYVKIKRTYRPPSGYKI